MLLTCFDSDLLQSEGSLLLLGFEGSEREAGACLRQILHGPSPLLRFPLERKPNGEPHTPNIPKPSPHQRLLEPMEGLDWL